MPNTAPAVAPEKSSPCIARQPILTADERVIGYELFFREDGGQRRSSTDREDATSATIDVLNFVGLGVLCDGRLAFINCSHHMLLSDYFALLPPNDVVIEIQETVPVDQDVIAACEKLQQAGYAIALDNFVPSDKREALIPYARYVKVDITRVLSEPCVALVKRYASAQCCMVAQKVESREQFLTAGIHGFTHFQGYFFRHPENMQARRIPANQMTYVRLLAAVSKPKVDFAEIEALIKHEPSLCYQLLRYLNSPLLGLSQPVLSVRNALTLLGEREAVRWIRMATTLVMGQEKTSDLVLSSLVRARFCELISAKVEHGNSDLFLMGMLSLIDAILAVPMGMVVAELALDENVKAQLLGAKSGKKTPLSPIYELMVAREVGDWELVTRLGRQLNVSLSFVADASNQAMRWAHEMTKAAPPAPAR
ncbi:MAG TPA: HDOD domain-containing protein [Candidatus Sulfotelmatobacter sp.]|nr:HDOD domain-containing protein [Candidatus Sulfotelmatobacter sp.]